MAYNSISNIFLCYNIQQTILILLRIRMSKFRLGFYIFPCIRQLIQNPVSTDNLFRAFFTLRTPNLTFNTKLPIFDIVRMNYLPRIAVDRKSLDCHPIYFCIGLNCRVKREMQIHFCVETMWTPGFCLTK